MSKSILAKLEEGGALLKNVTESLDTQYLCDIEIFCDETCIGSFHKIILAAQCSYFRKFLKTESKQWHFQAQDEKVVKETLLYLYGKSIEVNLQNAFRLLKFATLLELDKLAKVCSNVVLQKTRSCDALKLRKYFVGLNLQGTVLSIDQIIFKNFNEVVSSPDFVEETFEYVNHLTKSNQLSVKDEVDVFEAIRKWIAHDYADRRFHVETLFMNVKVPLMSLKSINEILDRDPLFNSSDELKDFLKESICYILNNQAKDQLKLLKNYHFKKRVGAPIKNVDLAKNIKTTSTMVLGNLNENTELSTNCHTNWQYGPKMLMKRKDFAATKHSDDIYVLGGRDATGKLITKGEIYHSMTGEWKNFRKLLTPRADHAVVRAGNLLVVTGGATGNKSQTDEVYGLDVSKNEINWIKMSPMLTARSHHNIFFISGTIYVIGGSEDGSNEAYNVKKKQWKYISKMKINRSQAGSAAIGKRIYVVGGVNFLDMFESTIEYYSCVDDTWTLLEARLPVAKCKLSAFADGGILYISGGKDKNGVIYDTVEKLEMDEKRWMTVGRMNQAQYGHHSLVVSKKSI